MFFRKFINLILVSLFISFFTACGGSNTTSQTVAPPPLIPDSDFNMILDVNQSTVTKNWKTISLVQDTYNTENITATIKKNGEYGTFVITDDSLVYKKTTETNETDIAILEVTDSNVTKEIKVSVESLYWTQIAAGKNHTVAIKSDGTLWSWGSNYYGQLGDGTTIDKFVPTQESTKATDWSFILVGGSHTIAIKNDGTLWSWGSNYYGELGDGTTTSRSIPTQESTKATDWSSVSVKHMHTVAIKKNGTLWAWGSNHYGKLGDGTTTNKLIPTQESTKATDWESVSTGINHTVAIKNDGTLWSWGYNRYGQLGDSTTISRSIPTQESSKSTDWKSVSARAFSTTGIKNDGTLWSWGSNYHGQLGDGTTTSRSIPIQESSKSTDWKSVSAGEYHTVAIKNDGTLWTWGYNRYGQLGDGTTTSRFIPTQESTKTTDWSSVSSGYYHTVAIKNDGTLWAWGNNKYEQLGLITTTEKFIPTQESTKSADWKSVSAGHSHTVAIKDDGTLWAWGGNSYGQLGDGTTKSKLYPIQENSKSIDWEVVSAWGLHTVAIKDDGTLWAWGDNEYGQLGDGTTTSRSIPTQESTKATDWSSVSSGYYHTVAIKNDGTLWAWGNNWAGQLGDGTTTSRSIPTQESTKATDWKFVSVGSYYTVAIKNDGTLWAWGYNEYGQLGDGTTTSRSIPTQESTKANDWESVSTGEQHTIAIKDNGTLWTWGYNKYNQLGHSITTIGKSVPTQESSSFTDWYYSSGGGNYSVAIKSDGTLWSWGTNWAGQLGDGTTKDKSVPTQESIKSADWKSVSAGHSYTVAIKDDGTLWEWGKIKGRALSYSTLIPEHSIMRE